MDHQGPLEVDRITIYFTAKINFSLRVARAKTRFRFIRSTDNVVDCIINKFEM